MTKITDAHCGDCRHWNMPYDERDAPFTRFRQCDKADDAKEYDLIVKGVSDRKFFASCMSESISGELITRDDFSCIEHEPRPEDSP